MLRLCSRTLLAIALVLTVVSAVHADTIYSETVNGELSSDGLNPTVITVAAGSNFIFGTTGGSTAPEVRDYFTIFVPTNLRFVSLLELSGTQAGNVGFLGLQSGTQVTLPVTTSTATGLLGWVHYGPTAADINILPTMAIPANGSSGFVPPLGPGNYAFWLQDSSPGTFQYAFNVQLAPVPEPSTGVDDGGAFGAVTTFEAPDFFSHTFAYGQLNSGDGGKNSCNTEFLPPSLESKTSESY